MDEIEFSLTEYGDYHPEIQIRPWLNQMKMEHHCRVHVRMISWETDTRD